MKKKRLKVLKLKKEIVTELGSKNSETIKGGAFLSIGHVCSIRNACNRLNTTHWGNACPTTTRHPHWSQEGACNPIPAIDA